MDFAYGYLTGALNDALDDGDTRAEITLDGGATINLERLHEDNSWAGWLVISGEDQPALALAHNEYGGVDSETIDLAFGPRIVALEVMDVSGNWFPRKLLWLDGV